MKTKILQSNLTIGELSPAMLARVDHEMYYAGVAKAQNCVIMPHGGLRRRPGLTKTKDSLLPGDGKIFAFEFSTIQDYVICLTPSRLDIFKDGELQKTITEGVPYTNVDGVKSVDVIQSGDIMILTNECHPPQMIQRQGSHTDWSIVPVPLQNIPTYDFGDGGGDEPVWSDTRGYPAVCTFFQSRLWFAGSTQKPNSVWASKINGFFDFDIGTGQADYGIFDTLDTEQYNQITNIFPGRNLMVFTTGSEFYQTAELVVPETSSWKRSTGYGSKRVRPVMVDGAVLFVDRIGRTVRSAVYKFEEDAFVSPSISVPSEHLIRDVVSVEALKGTNIDVSDFVYVINADGTMAVLNTLRSQGTEGWTQWTTEGKFTDVVAVNNVVYFMCERVGEFHLEYMNEGTTTDHNSFAVGQAPETFNVIHGDDNVVFAGDNVVYTDHGTGSPITEIDLDLSPAMQTLTYKMLLDHSVMEDVKGEAIITLPRPAYDVEVGLDVPLEVLSMPMNVNTQTGASRNNRSRIIRAMINVQDSKGIFANMNYAPDRKFVVVLDKATEPFSGFKEIFLLGFTRNSQLRVYQDDPLPFKLLGLGWEIEVGDL